MRLPRPLILRMLIVGVMTRRILKANRTLYRQVISIGTVRTNCWRPKIWRVPRCRLLTQEAYYQRGVLTSCTTAPHRHPEFGLKRIPHPSHGWWSLKF